MRNGEIQSELREYFTQNLTNYLGILEQMVSVNSFTTNIPGINQLGKLTADLFSKLGFEAEFVPSENPRYGDHLILVRKTRIPNQAPIIALVSHLDTVFPPEDEIKNDFHWRPDGDRLYGPGSVDIKGGTVLLYMVLDGLKQFDPELFDAVNWYVLLNAAEEVLERDFGMLCRQRLPADTLACLVFEGGYIRNGAMSVVTARKGMATYRIKVQGKAAHAGGAHENGANAIVQLAKTVARVAELTDYKEQLTFNIGTITGGTVLNRVPHYAEARGEMRAFSPEVMEAGIARLVALKDDLTIASASDGFPCQVDIDIFSSWSPWPQNPATDNLLAIWQEAGQEMGEEVIREERGGLSDGNLLWDYIPTLDGLGPVGANAHCSERSADGSKDQEYVNLSSFVPKAILDTLAIRLIAREGLSER